MSIRLTSLVIKPNLHYYLSIRYQINTDKSEHTQRVSSVQCTGTLKCLCQRVNFKSTLLDEHYTGLVGVLIHIHILSTTVSHDMDPALVELLANAIKGKGKMIYAILCGR